MKWNYKKLKKRGIINVIFFEQHTGLIKTFIGRVEEEIKEDMPRFGIKKGDFWVYLGDKRMVGKIENIFNISTKKVKGPSPTLMFKESIYPVSICLSEKTWI